MNFLMSFLSLLGATAGLFMLREQTTAPRESGGRDTDTDGDTGNNSGDNSGNDNEDPRTPPPEIVDPDPQAPEQEGDGGSGGEGDTIPTNGEDALEIMTGRVSTLMPEGDDIASIRILEGLEHGNVTVNPDNTLAVVLTQTDLTGDMAFSYEVTHNDGTTSVHDVDLDVVGGAQEGGWGTGEAHYMLETDADDRVIVDHGENHEKVYISGSSDALSLEDIAALEGLNVSDINGAWLAENGGYGASEGMALAQDAGRALWDHLTPRGSNSSNWLLLEKGYEYDDIGRIFGRDVGGESELNPLYLGAWGEGDRPEVSSRFYLEEGNQNIVVQDVVFSGEVFILYGENLLFDNIKLIEEGFAVQESDSVTIRNSEFFDIIKEAPGNGDDWDSHTDRHHGLYADGIDGLLLEGNFFDHIAWEEGYDYNGSGSEGQPPSMYSHNMYLNARLTDVTLRDTISMEASSFGAQLRSGGFVEDNAFIDNPAGFISYGGDYNGAGAVGNYSLIADNLVTSGAHLEAKHAGAHAMGLIDHGEMSTLVDNIVAHLADPNNPDELANKKYTDHSIHSDSAHYNDTIVWNWKGTETIWVDSILPERNAEDLNQEVLDQTTIQLFTAQLLGDPDATIADLATYLRAQADGDLDNVVDADLIIKFFQTGFGIAPDIRATEETLRFVPNDLGDGVRWDNRMNWDTDDLPGTQDGDSVDLGGNHVVFGTNATIDKLDFGPEGALNVYGGKLEATGGMTGEGGSLNVEGAGQAWIDGSDGSDIDVTVTGGRFVNTGDMSGVDLTASGGQTVLATDGAEFDVSDGHRLAVEGSDAKVGFDGDAGGIAILDLADDATVAFEADADGVSTIQEFRTGALGDETNVQSGIDLGGSALTIDLSGLSAETVTDMMLMSSDELVGLIDEAMIEGLGARDATIMIDYETDTVTLQLSEGSGQVSIETTGSQSDVSEGSEDLWAALTADHGVVSESSAMTLPGDEEEQDRDTIEMIL